MNRKMLIVYIAAVLALAAGLAAVMMWPSAQPEPGPPATTDGNASPTELVNEDIDGILEIAFMPQGGAQYTIRYLSDTGEYSLFAPDAIFPGKQADMRSVFSSAIRLTSLNCVAENATDSQLNAFGLDEPVMTWRVVKKDGTQIELMAGAQQAAGSGRYARMAGSREVFLLTGTQGGNLTKTADDLYDLTFFPYPASTESSPTWMAINYCLIEKSGGAIEIHRRTEEEFEDAPFGASAYKMTQPALCEVNEYNLKNSLLEPVTGIYPVRIVEVFPVDLTAYGLVDPARLTLACEAVEEGADEWRGSLLIGEYNAEQGGRYVMIEGYDAVLLDPVGDYGFLEVKYDYLRSSLIWLYSITTVSSVKYELEGVVRTLQFEHNDEDETLRAWLDGAEILDSNGRRMYSATLSIPQTGAVEAGIPGGEPDYRITIYFRDGGSDTVELYKLSDSQFLIVHGGINEGLITTRISLQQNILSKFEILDKGEDLPVS